jgi:hypothetical protein
VLRIAASHALQHVPLTTAIEDLARIDWTLPPSRRGQTSRRPPIRSG